MSKKTHSFSVLAIENNSNNENNEPKKQKSTQKPKNSTPPAKSVAPPAKSVAPPAKSTTQKPKNSAQPAKPVAPPTKSTTLKSNSSTSPAKPVASSAKSTTLKSNSSASPAKSTSNHRQHPRNPRNNRQYPKRKSSFDKRESYYVSQGFSNENIITRSILHKFFGLIAKKWHVSGYGFYNSNDKGEYFLYLGKPFSDSTHVELQLDYDGKIHNFNEIDNKLDFDNHLHLQHGFGDENVGIVTQKYIKYITKDVTKYVTEIDHKCILNDIYNRLFGNYTTLEKDARVTSITKKIYENSGYIDKSKFIITNYEGKQFFF